MGLYFESNMTWHSQPGPLSDQAGFRMFEMHKRYFSFTGVPWWEKALKEPAVKFPKTFKYLKDKLPQDTLKEQQIKAGIKAAHEELAKMSRLLLLAPVVFLLLTDPIHGPALGRNRPCAAPTSSSGAPMPRLMANKASPPRK